MSLSKCAGYCFDTGLSNNGCVDAVDFYCQCPKSDALITAMTPCLLNLCSSLEMTEAVIYWQTLCMMAVSSMVQVPGFATDSMGIAINPTMSVSRTTGRAASLSMSAPETQTFTPSFESLASEFSFLVSQTALWTDEFASETDGFSTPTGASSRPIASSSSLSTGAKAGIAVGVVGSALAIALGVWLFCRRRRRSKAAVPEPYTVGNEGFSEKMPVVTTAPQVEPKHPTSSIQRKPVQHSHIYPEMDVGGAVSPVSVPQMPHQNELEGQYWPAAHERRGELPG
ncbi:hypothetical protein BU25DRAFT_195172 [Macroventuria anomochaeta]|uniref:Uncharacterized protein n=1 Tax=Macroventuria anomochaeta TaxID=301207 RepID=A0ACB6SCH4_9PLEO|nr:uncharacterized protein BU25DRAFT_195172 [Macroventuria anomochaeta]KAF2631698.1 hypothetical protein BU25DRAFT_195172 [Macroventuria anomochaeta]